MFASDAGSTRDKPDEHSYDGPRRENIQGERVIVRRQVTIAAVLLVGFALQGEAQDATVDVPANARAFEVASVRVADHTGMSQLTTPQGERR